MSFEVERCGETNNALKNQNVLGGYVVSLDKYFPRRFESSYYLYRQGQKVKEKALRSFETSGTVYSNKQCNIPEDLTLQ